jgi:tetratricopeptide (TPR) repeat protein
MPRLLSLALGTLILAAACGPAAAGMHETLIAQGKDAISLGRFAEGEKLFRKATEIIPESPEASYGAGVCAQRQGKLTRAVSDFETVLKAAYANPAMRDFHSLALLRIGEIRLAQRRFRQAAEIYSQGIANEPANPEFHYGLGVALRARRQNEAALKQFEETLRLDPRHAGAMIGKGSIFYELGDIRKAFDLLREAVNISPRNPLPYGVMSSFYREMNEPYREHMMLGQYYYYTRDFRRAISEYRTAQAIEETAESHHALGVTYLDTGDPKAAEVQFRRALKMKIEPADTTWSQLSHSLARQGRIDEAGDALAQALKRNERRAQYHSQAAWLFLRQRKYADAAKSAARAVELEPDLASGHRFLGDSLSGQGKHRDAIKAYEKSLALDGAQPDVYLNLGWAYEAAGESVSAQRNYELFLRTDPEPEVAEKVREQIRKLLRGQRKSKGA